MLALVKGWRRFACMMFCVSALAGLTVVHATAEQLRVTNVAGETQLYSFDELDEIVGLVEREIPDDFLFRRPKHYLGYDLNRLFDVLNLSKEHQYLLVCTDGYEIEFDARRMKDGKFLGFLARADLEAVSGAGADASGDAWIPYNEGVNPESLSPFYLAWSAEGKEAQKEARKSLPWPYALNEIRVHDPEALHAEARPVGDSDALVQEGFDHFKTNCMKCHKINSAGGSLGPELTSSPSVVFTSDDELADVIGNIRRYYPNTKMPTYNGQLSSHDMTAIVRYLRHINEQADAAKQ